MKEELTDIQGVGDKTADKIMTVFEDHTETGVPEHIQDDLEAAMSYYENEEYAYAGKFLRRVMEDLD